MINFIFKSFLVLLMIFFNTKIQAYCYTMMPSGRIVYTGPVRSQTSDLAICLDYGGGNACYIKNCLNHNGGQACFSKYKRRTIRRVQ